ncbi:MAG: 6-phosphogluconolactonase [Spirochaetaceae bacterium]|nr:6-phosphogluconolactonase [Spirochaetaceae bacterium]
MADWTSSFLAAFRSAVLSARSDCSGRSGRGGSKPIRLCLAGGTTPWPLYRALSSAEDPGEAMELWPSDERAVSADDPRRNGLNIADAFAGCAWSRRPLLRPWPEGAGEGPCAAYEKELRAELGEGPFFDLAVLGVGGDGHTASLFPGDAALLERRRLTAPATAPSPPRERLTLTYPALASSRSTLFVVRGPEKRELALRLAAEDPALPASAAGGGERCILFCETASAP